MTRARIYQIIEAADEKDRGSRIYDIIMMVTIIISIFPMAFKEEPIIFTVLDKVTVTVFIIDYILRLITADLKLKKGAVSYLAYPLTPMAILDLLSILPSLTNIDGAFRLLKIFRLFRTLAFTQTKKSSLLFPVKYCSGNRK